MGNIDVFVDGVEPVTARRYSDEANLAPAWPERRVSLTPVGLVVHGQQLRSRAAIRVILERIAVGNCRHSSRR